MASLEISVVAGLALAGFLFTYLLWLAAARRGRRAKAQAAPGIPAPQPAETRAEAPAELVWRLTERRLEALETALGDLGRRLAALDAEGPARVQELAGSLAHLIRDKNAGFETAMAGLDQLRTRLKALEQLGDLAEGRGLIEKVFARLDALQAERNQAEARTEVRLAVLEAGGGTDLAGTLTRLLGQRDAALETVLETVLGRLAPLEAEVGGLGTRLDAPRAALERLAAEVAALGHSGSEARERLAALAAELAAVASRDAGAPVAELAERLAGLHAQRDAALEAVMARLAPLEAGLAWLAELEARSLTEDQARAEAQAIAAQLIAARTVAEQTEIFSDRLTLLEASLPRLSFAQTLMVQALERQAAVPEPSPAEPSPAGAQPAAGDAAATDPAPAAEPGTPAAAPAPDQPGPERPAPERSESPDLAEIWRMPGVVSLHHG